MAVRGLQLQGPEAALERSYRQQKFEKACAGSNRLTRDVWNARPQHVRGRDVLLCTRLISASRTYLPCGLQVINGTLHLGIRRYG